MNNDRLKFRVWDKSLKTYYKLKTHILFEDGFLGEHDFGEANQEKYIVEMCTGLRDKNGTLIYEGDNIQFVQKRGYYTDKGDVYTIEFGTFRFCGFGWRSHPENTVDFALTESAAKKCVIVGNIHTKDKK